MARTTGEVVARIRTARSAVHGFDVGIDALQTQLTPEVGSGLQLNALG